MQYLEYRLNFLGSSLFCCVLISTFFIEGTSKDMFAVSQQISSVAHIVNVLSRDLFELKKQVANINSGETSSSSIQPAAVQSNGPSHDDMQRAISTSVSDCHARITEVKRVVDAVKADLGKDIALLETSLSRKIEGNVNKMLNDKIAVALDTYKNSIKDMILTELQAQNASPDASVTALADTPNVQDDFEIDVTIANSKSTDPPTTTTTTKRSGRKASASKAAVANVGKDA